MNKNQFFVTSVASILVLSIASVASAGLRIIYPPTPTTANKTIAEARNALDAAREAAEWEFKQAVFDSIAELQVGEVISLAAGNGRTVSTNHIFQKDFTCENGVLSGEVAAVTTENGVLHVLGVGDITGVQLKLHVVDAEKLNDKKFGLWVTEVPENSRTTSTKFSLPVVDFVHQDYEPKFVIDANSVSWDSGRVGDSWHKEKQDVDSVYILLCDAEDVPILAARVAK